jgi:hypothetical protein
MTDTDRESAAKLADLPMFWQGRANALRILDSKRDKSDDGTLRTAEAYKECARELHAVLSTRATPPTSDRESAAKLADRLARETVENWLLECDGAQALGFVQSELLQRQIATALRAYAAGDARPSPLPDVREATIEECAQIADPWPGFPTVGSCDLKLTDADKAVIKARKDIAAAIRSLSHPEGVK